MIIQKNCSKKIYWNGFEGGISMNGLINPITIAENIKKLRLLKQLTQIEMADTLGYSERTIRRLETNGTYDLFVVNLIAQTFNVSVVSILFN